jgi:hypothetical protein
MLMVLGLELAGGPLEENAEKKSSKDARHKKGRRLHEDFLFTTYVHSVRPCIKQPTSGNGKPEVDIIIVLRQKEKPSDSAPLPLEAGATLILSLEEAKLKYSICKRLNSRWRKEHQQLHLADSDPYSLGGESSLNFAALHGVTR